MAALGETKITAYNEKNGDCNLKVGEWYSFVKTADDDNPDGDNPYFDNNNNPTKINDVIEQQIKSKGKWVEGSMIIKRLFVPTIFTLREKIKYELPYNLFTGDRSIPLKLTELKYCYYYGEFHDLTRGRECILYNLSNPTKIDKKNIIDSQTKINEYKKKNNEDTNNGIICYEANFSINGDTGYGNLLSTVFSPDAEFIHLAAPPKDSLPISLPTRSEKHKQLVQISLEAALKENETIIEGKNLKPGNWYKFIRSECEPENLKAEEEFGFTDTPTPSANEDFGFTGDQSTTPKVEEETFGFGDGGGKVKINSSLFEEENALTSTPLKLLKIIDLTKGDIKLIFCYNPLPKNEWTKNECKEEYRIICEINSETLFVETDAVEQVVLDVKYDNNSTQIGGLKRRSVKNRKPHNHNKKNTHKRKHTKKHKKYIKKNKSKTHKRKKTHKQKHTKQYK